jgi:cytochrome b561
MASDPRPYAPAKAIQGTGLLLQAFDHPYSVSAGDFMSAVGQWAVYALILLHVGATARHAAVRRDGVLNRMLPPQDEP